VKVNLVKRNGRLEGGEMERDEPQSRQNGRQTCGLSSVVKKTVKRIVARKRKGGGSTVKKALEELTVNRS